MNKRYLKKISRVPKEDIYGLTGGDALPLSLKF